MLRELWKSRRTLLPLVISPDRNYNCLMSSTFAVTVQPAACMRGRVRPPGDKSISHRYAMLAAIADGPSMIHGYSTGADCASTLHCLRALGVPIEQMKRDRATGIQLEILGVQMRGLHPPGAPLDAGNSGSTMRMLAGILAAHPFSTTMTGDSSLRRRPMRRIIVPLERMGARFTSDDGRPPLTILGTDRLEGIDFQPDVPSAQVKSAVLFAGLHAGGVTPVVGPVPAADPSGRAPRAFGPQVLAAVATQGGELSVSGAQELGVKESDRISGLAEGLRLMGGQIDEQPDGFHVRGRARLRGGEVDAKNDHRLAMAFAIAALGATGPTIIHDAGAAGVSYPEFFTVLESLRA